MLRLVCHTIIVASPLQAGIAPWYHPPMTGPQVELDAELAALAEAKAAANGERLEDVLERMVLAYLRDE